MHIKLFDINRDGKSDVIDTSKLCMDSCTDGVETWLGHNTRTFTHYSSSLSENQTGYAIRTGVTFGDFDLDGILDLATGAGDPVPEGFLMFNRLPNNSIAPLIFRSVQSKDLLSDTEIISGDFNGDKKADLAITYEIDNSVLVMTNTTPPGPCSGGPLYSIHLCSPSSGLNLSPVQVSACVNSDRTVTAWKIYMDGVAMANGTGANVNAALTPSANSQHRITVKG